MKLSMFRSSGFTLIELMVVIAISAIISTIGVGSFINYNQTQIVKGAAEDIASLLLVARSRALSQVKPNTTPCDNPAQGLDGYKVIFNSSTQEYSLLAQCGGNPTKALVVKKLPANVFFDSATTPTLPFSPFFRTLINTVENPTVIKISGFGSKIKNISITADGAVNVN